MSIKSLIRLIVAIQFIGNPITAFAVSQNTSSTEPFYVRWIGFALLAFIIWVISMLWSSLTKLFVRKKKIDTVEDKPTGTKDGRQTE